MEFADLFADRGGFDLILGNPPWIKFEWNEGRVIGDAEPRVILRNQTAVDVVKDRLAFLTRTTGLLSTYLAEYAEFSGTKDFLTAKQTYPLLGGGQANSYKTFLSRSWDLVRSDGVTAFVHPENMLDDPKGKMVRRLMYQRLRYYFHFRNELPLFEGTNDHGQMTFSVGIYGGPVDRPCFSSVSNLFHPSTIDACFIHDGTGYPPGVKTTSGKWELAGHRDRIVSISLETLALFAEVFEASNVDPLEATFPIMHSVQVLEVLRVFAGCERRMNAITRHFDITAVQDVHSRLNRG